MNFLIQSKSLVILSGESTEGVPPPTNTDLTATSPTLTRYLSASATRQSMYLSCKDRLHIEVKSQ